MKEKLIPPKPPGRIETQPIEADKPELIMIVNFMQDREEFAPNQALAEKLGVNAGFYISKSDYKDCKGLNHFLNLLIEKSCISESDNTRGNPDAIQAMSLVTFIMEASTHPEYCTTYMLRKFSNVISGALETLLPIKEFSEEVDFQSYGFLDMVDDSGNACSASDFNLTLYGLTNPITPEMLKEIHDRTWKPKSDSYRCQSDNIIHLLIQVCYAILMHYFRQGDIVRICDNCGQIFIPKRSSDKYCTRKAPQDGSKSCGQYMKAQNQRIHNNNDEFKREHDRILRRLGFDESERFKEEYKATYGNSEARQKMLERWAEEYPPKRKKGAKRNEEK